MDRDQKAIEYLVKLELQLGRRKVLDELNQHNPDPARPRGSHDITRYLKGQPMREWVRVAIAHLALLYLRPYGSVFIQDAKDILLVQWVLERLRSDDTTENALRLVRHLRASVHSLSDVSYPADTSAVLAFLHGLIHVERDELDHALPIFEVAVRLAQKNCPARVPRYETNVICLKRDLRCLEYRKACEQARAAERLRRLQAEHAAFLSTMLDEQVRIYKTMTLAEDRALALKHLMRIASLIPDVAQCKHYLKQARDCDGFGKTPEQRDQAIRTFIDARWDKDNDLEILRLIVRDTL